MAMPPFADPANLMVEAVEDGPEGETSLGLLQTIYRDRRQPLNVRVRCAIEALPFENPKLNAVANTTWEGSFGDLLDKAIERTNGLKLINTKPVEPHQPLKSKAQWPGCAAASSGSATSPTLVIWRSGPTPHSSSARGAGRSTLANPDPLP